MVSFRFVFLAALALTIASGAASIYLVAAPGRTAARDRIAERLAQIAVIGTGAIMMALADFAVE